MNKKGTLTVFLIIVLLMAVSCSHPSMIVATYMYGTESEWTLQPTYTRYPTFSTPSLITKEITKYVVATETNSPTITSTEIPKNTWFTFGPPGSENMTIISLAINPHNPFIVFAAGVPGTFTEGKKEWLFTSDDAGLSWSTIDADLDFYYFNSILIDPINSTNMFVSTLSGIYASKDGGSTWQHIIVPTEIGFEIEYLTIDTNNPTTLYGGGDGGIYESLDSGRTWHTNDSGVPLGLSINSIVLDRNSSKIFYAGGSFYGHVTTGEILKSVNGGKDWEVIKSDLEFDEFISMTMDNSNPMVVYAGMKGGILKSVDGGKSWRKMNTGLDNTYIMALVMDPSNPSVLYAGTQGGGVYKTVDGGWNWVAINAGFPEGERIFSLAIDPLSPSIIYAGTDEGVFVIHQES